MLACLQGDRVFDAIEAQFEAASLDSTLKIDGAKIGHGPAEHAVPLAYLRELMLDSTTDIAIRDAAWTELVRLAQADGGDWQLAAVWMMLPGLRKASRKIAWSTGVEAKEADAEVAAGFIEALHAAEPSHEHLGAHLWWQAYNHGRRACAKSSKETPVEDLERVGAGRSTQEPSSDSLAEAVYDGVLTEPDAELIGRTRVEGERLGAVADQMGLRYHACRQRRARAESRLAGYLLVNGAERSEERAADVERGCARRRSDAA